MNTILKNTFLHLLPIVFMHSLVWGQESAPPDAPIAPMLVPPIRLLQPELRQSLPPQVETPAGSENNSTPSKAAVEPQRNESSVVDPGTPPKPTAAPATTRSTIPPRSRRRIRIARAPNMFGDFFNAPPTLNFTVPLIAFSSNQGGSPGSPEIFSPTSGAIQNPTQGGGPRLKISDNFSPIPRSRVFFQSHYFHNLFSARLADDNAGPTTGALGTRESVFVSTFGAEFMTMDGKASIELRLPLIHAPSTNNTLVDQFFGPVASQSASNEPVGNLSLIVKHVISEDRDYLMSGGFGISLPTASDVTGRLAHVNYAVENETLNLIPFIAILFSPREDTFIQFHTQLDVPIGDDDFLFSEQPLAFYVAESGKFGSLRESIYASFDLQMSHRLLARPTAEFLRGVSLVLEFRYTAALNSSRGVTGTAGEFFGDPDTAVSVEVSPNQTTNFLNMTLGLQADLAENWFLRCGQVFPLIDNDSFTAETMLHLERRF